MADDEKEVVSMSGQPVWHHGESKEWEAPQGEMCLEQISDHIEAHIGPVEMVFHEVLSDTVHIDVHHVAPSDERPFHTLITSGMSDLPMTTPHEDVPRYLELLINLPVGWKMSQQDWEDERWYWPIRQLKYLARFPHKLDTFLGYGHTVPNGDPPKPYADDTKLMCMLLLPQLSHSDEFDSLLIDEEKTIQFMSLVPIYQEEMDLKLRKGTDPLLERFEDGEVSDVIDVGRPNTAKKRFLFF